MRARVRTQAYEFEFEGSADFWNELLQPLVGGPLAPPDPEPVPEAPPPPRPRGPEPMLRVEPAPAAARRPPAREDRPTRAPAARPAGRPAGPRPPQHRSAPPDRQGRVRPPRQPAPPLEPSSDATVLYRRLAALGRRGEKDAVLAAVWFVAGGSNSDVTSGDVERHLRAHGVPADVKVKPNLAKHVGRTKMLDPGSTDGTVRLSPKGLRYVRGRMIE